MKGLPLINTSKGVITCAVEEIRGVSCSSLCSQTLCTEISRVVLALDMLRDYELSVEQLAQVCVIDEEMSQLKRRCLRADCSDGSSIVNQ